MGVTIFVVGIILLVITSISLLFYTILIERIKKDVITYIFILLLIILLIIRLGIYLNLKGI